MRRWLVVVVAACWTGEPAPSPPMQPTAAPPQHRWRTVSRPAPPDAPGPPTPQQAATSLAQRLRSTGASDLPTYVWGPVVVLDLDTGTVSVLCGNLALQAARDWGTKLADPARPKPTCMAARPGQLELTCVQIGSAHDVVYVTLDDPDQPHLSSAIVGAWQSSSRLGSLIGQLKAQTPTASCP
jgi:hypothetical protein